MSKILIDEATVKLALEALETLMLERGSIYDKAITALQEALAEQPAQQEYTSFAEWANDYVRANLHKLKPAQQEPLDSTQISKVWWDGEKLMAKPIPFVEFYKPAQRKPLTDGLDVPMLTHCMIAVRDWLGGGCDIHDIPRPEIAALVVFADYGIKENT